jgi:hypothetical protein
MIRESQRLSCFISMGVPRLLPENRGARAFVEDSQKNECQT